MIKSLSTCLSYLTLEPFCEGLEKLGQIQQSQGVFKKAVCLLQGVFLMVPLVNVIISFAIKYFGNKEVIAPAYHQPRLKDPVPVNAAGVLPVRIQGGKIQYLIGKEAGGYHDKTWADFGGKREADENAYETAARECYEETCGLLGTRNALEESLKKAPYIQAVYPKKNCIDYRMYFLFVSEHDHITDKAFSALKSKTSQWHEKSQIARIDSDDLVEVIRNIYLARSKYQPIAIIERRFEKLRHPFCRTLSMYNGKNLEKLIDFGDSCLLTKAI